MLALRPYQHEAVQAVRSAALQGQRRILCVLATGAGKTVIAAHLAHQTKGRVLMVVNRDELVKQSVQKLALFVPPDQIGIVQGAEHGETARYVVASIQTLARPARLHALLTTDQADPFRLVIVDESHHIGAVTYQRLLAALDLDRATASTSRVLLGITATPFRTDGQSLHQFFDTVAYRKEIADLIPLGYLAPIRGLRVYSPVALPDPTQTDFDETDLALAVDTPGRNTLIVETWQKHAADRHTVVFAVNVAHAQHLAEAFQAAGIAADWIAGSLPLTERRRRLQAFHDRQIQVLVNCTILTEGWDEPAVNCLVMARPTMSPGLYIQMVGRGLRPHPGKTDCLVLDVTDRQHSLSTCTLDLIAQPDPAQKPRKRRADAPPIRADHEPAEIAGRVDLIPLPWDLLGTSPFVWHPDVDGPWLEAGPNIRIQCRPLGSELFEVWLFDHRQRTRLSDQPLPFAYAQGLAEDWVRAQKWTGYAAKDAAWRSRRVSPKQQAILDRLHIPYDPATLTQEAASRLIRDATDHQPATAKQRRWLAAHQIPIPEGLTRQEASTLISAHGARDAPADAASSSAPSSP